MSGIKIDGWDGELQDVYYLGRRWVGPLLNHTSKVCGQFVLMEIPSKYYVHTISLDSIRACPRKVFRSDYEESDALSTFAERHIGWAAIDVTDED